jgi:hypothetical protein
MPPYIRFRFGGTYERVAVRWLSTLTEKGGYQAERVQVIQTYDCAFAAF